MFVAPAAPFPSRLQRSRMFVEAPTPNFSQVRSDGSSLDICPGLDIALRSRSSTCTRLQKIRGDSVVAGRDEELIHSCTPALKYRAKVTPPLRGEEQP